MWQVCPLVDVTEDHVISALRIAERLRIQIPWPLLWGSFKEGLLTLPDILTALKAAHRGLFTPNRRAGDGLCQLCGGEGSILHLANCAGLERVWERMERLVSAGGEGWVPGTHPALMRLLGVVLGEGGCLRMAKTGNLAVIKLTLKFIWWDLYRHSTEGQAFDPEVTWGRVLGRLANRIWGCAGQLQRKEVRRRGMGVPHTRKGARDSLRKLADPLVVVKRTGQDLEVLSLSEGLAADLHEFRIPVPMEALGRELDDTEDTQPRLRPIRFVPATHGDEREPAEQAGPPERANDEYGGSGAELSGLGQNDAERRQSLG
jgi:hypothetical protein